MGRMKAIKSVYVTLNVRITTARVQPFQSMVLKRGNG